MIAPNSTVTPRRCIPVSLTAPLAPTGERYCGDWDAGRMVEGVSDNPFGFALPGGEPPDPRDPQQMQRFLAQLQQLLVSSASGPVNWGWRGRLLRAS